MQNINVILFLFLVVLFASCTQEDSITDIKSSQNYTLSNSQISSQNKDKHYIPKTPDNEIINFAQNELNSTQNWKSWVDNFSEEFGLLSWQHSIIDITSSEHYVLSIPLIESQVVTGQLLFIHHPNHYHFNFFPSYYLDDVYLNGSIEDIEGQGDLIYALNKLSYFDRYLSHYKNVALSSFILDYNEAHQNDIVFRSEWSTIEWYGYYVTEDGTPSAATAGEISVFIECRNEEPSSEWAHEAGTKPPRSGGPGGGRPVIIGDNEEEEEEEDCAISILTIEALAILDNTTLTDPCDSDRDIIEEFKEILCSETPSDEILDPTEVIETLEEFIADGGNSIIISPEFEAACPCFVKIINRLSNSDRSDFLSQVFGCIDDSEVYTQKFEFHDGDGFHNLISYNSGTATGKMLIPKSACEENEDGTSPQTDLDIGAQFIHEFLHAHFADLFLNIYPNGLPPSFMVPHPTIPGVKIINTVYWGEVAEAYNATQNPPDTNQHVLFFTHLLDLITEGLRQIAGARVDDDFLYYAHLIVNTPSIASQYGSELGIPTELTFDDTGQGEYFEQMYADWNAIGGEDFFTFGCD